MKLNCKPGDLAVIVKGHRIVVGRIARVTKLAPVCYCSTCKGDPIWELEEPIYVDIGGVTYSPHELFDSCLKPLRDGEGTDETLTWAPVPATLSPTPEPLKETT